MRQKNSGFALDSDDGLMLESARIRVCVAGEIESLADVSAWRFPDAGRSCKAGYQRGPFVWHQ